MGDILIWQGGGNYVSGVRKARNGVGWRADWPGWPLNHLGITHPGNPSGRLRRVRRSYGTSAAGADSGPFGVDRAMSRKIQATAKPSAGVPRRSSLAFMVP